LKVRLSTDVVVPLYVMVSLLLGALGASAACIWLLAGLGPLCEILPVVSASCALIAVFPWNLHRAYGLDGRRVAVWLIALAILCAVEAVRCRR